MSDKNLKIIKLPVVASTNDYLKELARNGESGPLVVVADEQTNGKGTKNRSFISEKGGIYLSILIKPDANCFDATQITPMTAVAVCDAIEKISGISPDIKWVNDLYIDYKKVAGILCESVILPNGEVPYVVVGIGVNLFKPLGGFANDIKDIATFVFEEQNASLKEEFIDCLLTSFFDYFSNFKDKTFLKKYRDKNIVIGKTVAVLKTDKTVFAKAIGINDNCNLVVEFEDETQAVLNSGEVSLKL